MAKVAVIMSVYHSDRLDYLAIAMESILSQSYQDITLFVYQDGSIPWELENYIKESSYADDRVKYIKRNHNQGLAVALNSLIDIIVDDSTYIYVARMDSDDVSRVNRIYKQVRFLTSNPDIDVCGTSCKEFGASFALEEKHLPETHSELLDFSITRCPFIHPSVMFRTSVFRSGIRYPINTALTEDMALWFELLQAGYKFSNINEVLLDYRLNEMTIKRRHGIGKAISEIKIRFRYMFILKRLSIKNVSLIFARLVFHLLPPVLMKFAYRKAR